MNALDEAMKARVRERMSKDPVYAFMSEGAAETPEMYKQKLEQFRQQAGTGGFLSPQTSGALGEKLAQESAAQSAQIGGALDRQSPMDFLQRAQGYQGIADARLQQQQQQELLEAQKRAARKAKRRGFASALGGVAGAVVGGAIGGPAGAQIGYGLGSAGGAAV